MNRLIAAVLKLWYTKDRMVVPYAEGHNMVVEWKMENKYSERSGLTDNLLFNSYIYLRTLPT